MRAWQVHELGDPADALELSEVPTPTPGDGEVLIKVEATALNFPDVLICRGQYQERPPLPFTPGLEVAGRVVDGDPTGDAQDGQRVAALPRLPHGGLAEYVVAAADEALPIPDEMPFDEAAGLLIVYQTAHVALHRRASLQPGETLLVHGGAGGVGSAAIQVGKAAGARVIGTATGADRAQVCEELGADLAVDHNTEDFVAVVNETTDGRGADVIFDPVGGEVFDRSRKCIAFEGRLITIGFAAGDIPTAPVNHVLIKNYSLVGVHWGLYRERDPEVIPRVHHDLIDLYLAGDIRPAVGLTVPFEDALDGFAALLERKVVGKVVVRAGP